MSNPFLKDMPPRYSAFLYGSRVYGSNTEKSDTDVQFIVPDEFEKKADWKNKLKSPNLDIHVWSQSDWQFALDDHRVYAIECWFLPENCRLHTGLDFKFKLDKAKLRNEFSRVASNSWVKAKKKMIVEADYNEKIAKKSIFHSFRIIDFGIQIASQGKITNYGSMNHILAELDELPADWDIIDDVFRERHNAISSKFREVCPKK